MRERNALVSDGCGRCITSPISPGGGKPWSSISSSWAPARPAACWPSGSRRTGATACWCWRRAAATGASSCRCRWAMARPSTTRRVNWMYQAEPDPGLNGAARLLSARQDPGRLLLDQCHGLYPRPCARTTRTGRRAGNPGWGWDEVLPAYKAIEDYAAGDPACRGRGGPLHISDIGDDAHPLCRNFICRERSGGPRLQRRLQRRGAGGRGAVPAHHQGRPPHVGGARLPAPGDAAQKPAGGDACAGDAPAVRGAARRRASTTFSAA